MNIEEYEKMLKAIDKEIEKVKDKDKVYANKLIERKKSLIKLINELKTLETERKIVLSDESSYRNSDAKLESIEKRRKALEKEYSVSLNRKSTDLRDFLSTLIGQVDKKIHNKRYAIQEDEVEEKIMQVKWELKEEKIQKRYTKFGLLRYLAPRVGLIAAGAIAMPTIATTLGPVVSGVLTVGLGVGGIVTLGKTISTIYNKIRYNGPRLERQYKIRKGSYFKNIKRSFKELIKGQPSVSKIRKSKSKNRLFGTFSESSKENNYRVNDKFKRTLLEEEDFEIDDLEEITSKETVLETNPIVVSEKDTRLESVPVDSSVSEVSPVSTEPYVRRRRMDRFHSDSGEEAREIVSGYDTSKMTVQDAIHISTKRDYPLALRELAFEKIAESFGNKRLSPEDEKKALMILDKVDIDDMDFNQLEKSLKYYGVKVKKDGKAEDIAMYIKLLNKFTGLNMDKSKVKVR